MDSDFTLSKQAIQKRMPIVVLLQSRPLANSRGSLQLGIFRKGGYNGHMFRKSSPPDQEGYYNAHVKPEEIAEGHMKKVTVAGIAIVLTRLNGQIVAFPDTCPHGAASLAKGMLSGSKICCSDHGYCFDIRTGALLWPDDEPYRLRRVQTKIVDGEIRLQPPPKRRDSAW